MEVRELAVFASVLALACAAVAFFGWLRDDASSRGVASWKLGLLLFLCPVLGLVVWLVYRPPRRAC